MQVENEMLLLTLSQEIAIEDNHGRIAMHKIIHAYRLAEDDYILLEGCTKGIYGGQPQWIDYAKDEKKNERQ